MALEDLKKEQYTELNRQLAEINRSWWLFPNYFWIVGLLIGGICIFYFHQIIIQGIAIIIIIYCVAQIYYRLGVKYGYVRGYESGHEAGVHKGVRISQDDSEEGRKREVETETD